MRRREGPRVGETDGVEEYRRYRGGEQATQRREKAICTVGLAAPKDVPRACSAARSQSKKSLPFPQGRRLLECWWTVCTAPGVLGPPFGLGVVMKARPSILQPPADTRCRWMGRSGRQALRRVPGACSAARNQSKKSFLSPEGCRLLECWWTACTAPGVTDCCGWTGEHVESLVSGRLSMAGHRP